MALKIREKRPGGKNSIKAFLNELDKTEKSASDMRDVWKVLIPDIKQALKYAFSDANPSAWAGYKDDKYANWKTSHGYPTTIGIMTGTLKKSVTDNAKIKSRKKKLIYKMNPREYNTYANKRVSAYAEYFDDKRPVMMYARKHLQKYIKKVVRTYIKKETIVE